MSFYTVTFDVFLILIPFAGVANRVRQLKKAVGLVNTTGVVTQFEYKIIGETSYLYIDIIYNFADRKYYGFDLDTGSFTGRGYEVGTHVKILVDPFNPRECRVEKNEVGDRLLRYLFGRFINSR